MRSSTHRGFSLIESAIVLGVVGLVIGGIWVAAASVNQKKQTEDVISAISIIHTNLSRLYSGNRPTTDIAVTGELLRQVTPGNMQLNATSNAVLDPLGGSFGITVTPEHMVFGFVHFDNDKFEKYCQILAPQLGRAFKRLTPITYGPTWVHIDTSNVIGGANDNDISTLEGAATSCGSEDGIIMYLSY